MVREVLIRSDLPPVQGPSSHGVKAGDWAFTAGMLPLAADSTIVAPRPGSLMLRRNRRVVCRACRVCSKRSTFRSLR